MFSLHMTNVSKQDVVKYICSAYFADGDSDGLLKLYESVKFFFFFSAVSVMHYSCSCSNVCRVSFVSLVPV